MATAAGLKNVSCLRNTDSTECTKPRKYRPSASLSRISMRRSITYGRRTTWRGPRACYDARPMVKPVILSGMRPTGRLHLGHLVGALDNWVRLQEQYQGFYSIVDWHALTTNYESTGDIRPSILDNAMDWLA